MAQATRTFRIFVSSTFSDLKEERNALQKYVFPRLRDLCMRHGCRFQAIDLRWGIREEAALDQQTMRICLEEIARCQRVTPKPNFIVLLGDRYGWRPLPFVIPADEFELIEQRITPAENELLRRWYKRDDNAVPPVWDLQPREGEFRACDACGARRVAYNFCLMGSLSFWGVRPVKGRAADGRTPFRLPITPGSQEGEQFVRWPELALAEARWDRLNGLQLLTGSART